MRLWKRTPTGNESITFYGARGERLGTYPLSTANQAVLVSPGATNVYFNGRLLGAPDRLGSTVATYPYGGRVHDHGAGPGQVRDVLPRRHELAGLRAQPLLFEQPGQVYVGGPVSEQRDRRIQGVGIGMHIREMIR